jgi:hypothetical protein
LGSSEDEKLGAESADKFERFLEETMRKHQDLIIQWLNESFGEMKFEPRDTKQILRNQPVSHKKLRATAPATRIKSSMKL